MPEIVNRLTVRVYYEDTDFSGRVYHASYVRFFERGRTEWLRQLGLSHDVLARDETTFAVRRLEIDFRAQAFIDDSLEIETAMANLKGPVLQFRQCAARGATSLAVAVVDVVAISRNRAVRPPRGLIDILRSLGVYGPVDPIAERG